MGSRCGQACLPPLPLQVLPATYDPSDPGSAAERQEVAIGALFLMMGRGLERLQVCGLALSWRQAGTELVLVA